MALPCARFAGNRITKLRKLSDADASV